LPEGGDSKGSIVKEILVLVLVLVLQPRWFSPTWHWARRSVQG
jgi:hypothetical protein